MKVRHELHEAVSRNRAERKMLAADARERIAALAPGARIEIALPPGQPNRRTSYQAINGAAWRVLGPGGYTVKQTEAGVMVKRVWEMPDA